MEFESNLVAIGFDASQCQMEKAKEWGRKNHVKRSYFVCVYVATAASILHFFFRVLCIIYGTCKYEKYNKK